MHGIDLSAESVAHASARYVRPNLKFGVSSIASLPFADATFDAVVSFETIEHVDATTQETFLREIRRVLKPDGFLVISTPDKHSYSELRRAENHFHVHEFYPEEFRTFLLREFPAIDFYHQRYVLSSLVTAPGSQTARLLRLAEPKREPSGRYLIAVCGKQKQQLDLTSLVDDELGLLGAKEQHISNLEGMVREEREGLELAREQLKLKDAHNANLEVASRTNLEALELAREQLKLKEAHVANLEAATEANLSALTAAREQLKLKDAHNANLEAASQANLAALTGAREQLALKDAHIGNLEKAIAATQSALEASREQLRLQSVHIRNLEAAAREHLANLAGLTEQLRLKDNQIKNLQTTIDELSPALPALRKQLELKDARIRTLEGAGPEQRRSK